jgi:Flp pilus assembly CpaE family ATPase
MATTTAITCTEKRGNVTGDVYEPGSVYTRTFTFDTENGAGFESGDTLTLATIPANTQIIAASAKSSVTQGSATFALNVTGTAFVTAVAVTATTTFQPLAVVVAQGNTGASDVALSCVIGGATCAAATVTLTLTCVALGTAAASQTTFTN